MSSAWIEDRKFAKRQLVKQLRQAHAIEVGAYNAYEGHWRSIKPMDSPVRGRIKWIQIDELEHKQAIEEMLKTLSAKPSKFQDAIFLLIGKTISGMCKVLPYKAAIWGAKVMEILGNVCYGRLAKTARDAGWEIMAVELEEMQRTEQEHEEYLRGLL